jgi:hypothetical protein
LSRKLEMMPLVGFEGEGEQEDHRRSSGAGTRGEEARSGCGGGIGRDAWDLGTRDHVWSSGHVA